MANDMKLYKFRPLADREDLKEIEEIIKTGFYCSDFLNFNDMNEGVFSINQDNIDIGVIEKQKYKICSFSGKNSLNSQLMWGHYANAGMGVVIEIEANNCKNIKEVVYSDKYSNLDSIKKILTHKTTEWQYEHEFRYLSIDADNKEKIGDITRIYFGTPYERLENYKKIIGEHTKLKEYLECKKELKEELKEQYPKIKTYDYKFT